MKTNNKLKLNTRSRSLPALVADRQDLIRRFIGLAGIVAALLTGVYAGKAAELPRPGDVIDAGDSYGLKDGSRVALQRIVNEAAVKHLRSKSVEATVRQTGINRDPLATIDNGGSSIVDVYYSEDSQAVARLLSAQEDG